MTTKPGRGALVVRAPDKLRWRWVRGEQTSHFDFGRPLTDDHPSTGRFGTGYALCIYDAAGGSVPIIQAVAPNGGTCARGRACWFDGAGERIEYSDGDADPDGIRRIRLKPGDWGRAAVLVTGRGENLVLPGRQLSLPVIVQLRAENGEGSTVPAIYGRRYDSAGSPLGGEFQVSASTYPSSAYYDVSPDVIMEPGGEFVVAWQYDGIGHCAAQNAILVRRYDSAGNPLGAQFGVGDSTNCYYAYLEVTPRLARTGGGGFVVAWASTANDEYAGYDTDIVAHRFDSAGESVGGVFRVNTYTTGQQRCVDVAGGGDGSFVVTWTQTYNPGSLNGYGQQFDSGGAAVGGNFLVNTDVTQGNVAHATSVAAAQNGDFVVVWTDGFYDAGGGRDGDGLGVFGQRFDDVGAFTCTPAPRTTCRTQTKDRGAFRFRENATKPARGFLAWRWPRGESTSNAELGDVFTDVSYAFCVYDSSPNPQPLLSAVVPPGGTCGPAAIPCWRELTGFGPPLFYLDGNRTQGGIVQLRLKPGATDNTRITTRARGKNLTLPATPLTAPVIVQLQGSHGACFTATYEERIRKNEGGVFRGRPGSPSAAFLDAGAAVLD